MKFPDVPTFRGFQAPGRFEGEVRDLEVVQGEVPSDLNGAFYRVGPDPQYPPLLGDDIPLNGDGMVSIRLPPAASISAGDRPASSAAQWLEILRIAPMR